MIDIACIMCLDPCLFICRNMVVVEVEAVMLCVVGKDTRCGPTISHRHRGSGRAIGLRWHANKPRVFQCND